MGSLMALSSCHAIDPTSFSPAAVSVNNINANEPSTVTQISRPVRNKRALIFRPLFVYRQQQAEKQRIRDQRQQEQQHYQDHHHAPSTKQPQKQHHCQQHQHYDPTEFHNNNRPTWSTNYSYGYPGYQSYRPQYETNPTASSGFRPPTRKFRPSPFQG